LLVLAHVEILRTELADTTRLELSTYLDKYLSFLTNLRMPNGQFNSNYSYKNGRGYANPSPYFDGEALLAMSKAAKYADYEELVPLILESAEEMYQINVTDALQEDHDSKVTKGFYQWSSMSFYEIHSAGWSKNDIYSDRCIDLAYWMIDVHKTLKRRKNTAYAHEGIAVAYELAKLAGNVKAQDKFSKVLNKALTKLISWQVGGPSPNRFIKSQKAFDTKLNGGIMNSRRDPWIRIDVVQHQTHALLLTRRFLF